MLFNSPEFILAFLPITLAGFFLLGRLKDHTFAVGWLILASLFFYGWWWWGNLPLLLLSITGNYLLGLRLKRSPSRAFLVIGVAANLLAIGYFKYTIFALTVVRDVTGAGFQLPDIVLPLAISFFTFQQIAYLVDANSGISAEDNFLHYCLFVTFFPQLIAGPIVHHKEMLPQFARPEVFSPQVRELAVGITIFGIGLFKKVVLSASVADYSDAAFAAAHEGQPIPFLEAWAAAVAFTLQIYFDFSGYSDMAIGLGRMFGIGLPVNFNSPYKATSIIDFWNRWHITLTRFLTGYIYTPLVISLTRRRRATGRPVLGRGPPTAEAFVTLLAWPTLFTMFLAGVWHGAGFQFVIYGLLHGAFLVLNHAWRTIKKPVMARVPTPSWLRHGLAWLLTFAAVVVAMVFFRSQDVAHALRMTAGMAGLNGLTLPSELAMLGAAIEGSLGWTVTVLDGGLLDTPTAAVILAMLVLVLVLPNGLEWIGYLGHDRPAAAQQQRQPAAPAGALVTAWRPTLAHAAMVGLILYVSIVTVISTPPTEFIYFDF